MRSLCLAGGGAKGAYQLGALRKWILEDGLDYDILCGISVGALNASCLAQIPYGQPKEAYHKLESFWDQASTDKLYKSWRVFGKVAALWKPSVLNSQPLIDWVTESIDAEAIKNSGRELRISSVCWDTGEYKVSTQNDLDIKKWVLASSSFPVFFSPIEINGQLWSDGGIRSVTPLGEAIRAGATEIDVVMCSNPDLPSPWDSKNKESIQYALRVVDLMSDEIIRKDLKVASLKNDLVELKPKYKKIKIRLLQPKINLIEDSLNFTPDDIKRMAEIGYNDACELSKTYYSE